MSGKGVHKVKMAVQPSFPNNRLSNRRRRKTRRSQHWIIEESEQYLAVPETVVLTPFEIPGPADTWPGTGGCCPVPPLPFRAGDSANDGQEIFGYDLTWMEQDSDGGIISHNVTGITASPVDAMNYWTDPRTGIYGPRDIDMDGISDYDETHYAEAYPFIVSWANQSRMQYIYEYQAWIDGGQSGDEPTEFNETQYLESQFNPFMKENVPPMIISMDVVTHYEYHYEYGIVKIVDQFWSEINLQVFDPSPLAVLVDVGNGYSWQSFPETGYYSDADGLVSLTFVSGLDYPSMYTAGYIVNVTVYDMAGNSASLETEMDGIFSGLVDFLEDIWNGLCGVFSAVADAVAAALSFLIEIIKGIITEMLDVVLQPIANAISGWINNMRIGLAEVIEELTQINPSLEYHIERAKEMLFNWLTSGTFFYSILLLGIALQVIGTVVSIYTLGSSAALTPLIDILIIPLIQQMIIGTIISGVGVMVGITAFATILNYVIPSDDPFWTEGFGLGLIGLGPALINFLKGGFKFGIEGVGLALAIAGIVVQVLIGGIPGNYFGLFLSAASLLITIGNIAPNDYNILDPFRNIEEILATVSFGYAFTHGLYATLEEMNEG